VTYLDEIASDIRNAVPEDALPDEDTTSLFLSYAVLLLAKGETVTGEDVHNAWVAWTLSKGEDHEMLVPFSELSSDSQSEDSPYVVAIRAVERRRAGTHPGPPKVP
jgi:hypothetical protein